MSEAFRTDEQELKFKFNQTKLPYIQLESRVLQEKETKEQHKSRTPINNNRLVIAGSSFVVLIVLFGALSSIPTFAAQLQKIPIVAKLFEGSILSYAGDSGVISGINAGLSSTYYQEVSDKGVTIKMHDFLYDGVRLSISTEITTEQPNLFKLDNPEVKINGILEPKVTVEPTLRIINPNKAIGIIKIKLNALQEKDDYFDLELNFKQVSDSFKPPAYDSKVAGEWNFKLPIENKAFMNSHSSMLSTNDVAKSTNGQFQLTSYLLTPATTELNINYVGDTDSLRFQLKDDQGMLIEMLDSSLTTDSLLCLALPKKSK